MIIDCAVYADGARLDGAWTPVEALHEARRHAGAYAWVGLREPDEAELAALAGAYALHELVVEDAVHAHQRPKLECHGDVVATVLKPARYVDPAEVVDIGEVLVMTGPDFVVTVRHGATGALDRARHRVDTDPALARLGPAAVLYAVADQVVDEYAVVLEGLDDDIDEVERQVFAPGAQDVSQRIYLLRREVGDFRRAVAPLAGPVERLARGEVAAVGDPVRAYLSDVHDHVLRVVEQVESFDRQLADVLAANQTQVSIRQNTDQRKISAWAAIALVPTMVGGIYGMNFEHMPELGWRYGYYLVLGVIVAACVLLHRAFRRNGWL